MQYFDFHHHQIEKEGIYNLNLDEKTIPRLFSIGLHPQDITENFEEKLEHIMKLSLQENCVAIGECGLDGLIEIDEKLQEIVFEKQILWANQIKKPIIIHCVRRFSELLKFKKMAKTPMIIHGFNKKENIAIEMLDHGFYLSFGKATMQNVSLQQIVKKIPLEKMFLETDDSDFEIADLYNLVLELKDISLENLQIQMNQNFNTIITS